MNTQIANAAAEYIKANFNIKIAGPKYAFDTSASLFMEAEDGGPESEAVRKAVASITKVHGRPEKFSDSHGVQYAWNFGNKQRVFIHARWSDAPEVGLVQF